MPNKAAWITVAVPADKGGSISLRRSAILSIQEANGAVTIMLAGNNTQLRLPGLTRAALLRLLDPPSYDNDDY
jgi:hypothetical protein